MEETITAPMAPEAPSARAGTPVEVPDVSPPRPPKDEIDYLVDYLSDRFVQRKRTIYKLAQEAREMRDKQDVVRLGYECVLFRMELDEWVAFAQQLLDERQGDQFSTAHADRAEEARERGSKRPDATLVKAQAAQFTAPLKRAKEELSAMAAWTQQILYWCQAQQRVIAAGEYGDYLTQSQAPPEDMEADWVRPPASASSLRRMRSH